MSLISSTKNSFAPGKTPSRKEAEEALKLLIRWIGDDPDREGLLETPDRVIRSFEEFFSGYQIDPHAFLSKTFEETSGFEGIVLLRDIHFESYCEHHILPIVGKAHIAYLPNTHVVGISKLARVVDVFARRLQIQEKMTAEIAECIDRALAPKGTAVLVEGVHHCMANRGVRQKNVTMVTHTLTGLFKTNPSLRQEVLDLFNQR